MLNISWPIYFHAIVTAGNELSTDGAELERKAEYIRQARTITAPSRQTPIYDFIKALPIEAVLSPAKDESGRGDMAVYRYSLKNLPYTVSMRIKDMTVIKRLPIRETIHKGIL